MTIQQLETIGKKFHDTTKHSPISVMLDPNYVDAIAQLDAFKIYPKFYRRFELDKQNPIHEFIRLTSAITFEKKYKYDSYQLRVNPSAGALYPTEIYVQIRGIKGIIDGIYHLEVATNSLTLIYELIDDGLESYILPNCLVKGFIFLVSCAYYRSSWKYKNRSLRYCFLDSGHHLGAIAASAYLYQKAIQVIFDFDKVTLNQDLGFENKEFITAAVISGEIKPKTVRKLRSPLPFVCPTDYFEANHFIEAGYRNTVLTNSEMDLFLNKKLVPKIPDFDCNPEKFLPTIINRRSARAFKGEAISQTTWEKIWHCLKQPLPTVSQEKIEIYLVINHVEGIKPGLYRELQLLKTGDFSEQAKYLCVNQVLARDSAITLFFASHYNNYQTAMQIAGWLGQRLYLISNYLGIGCSGIGAYHDDETQEFLGTNQDILYAMAIGN